MVQGPRPSGSYYTKRFMQALGSANVYTHGAACNMSKNSGFTQVIGAGDYLADVENAKACMFIGRSYADAIRPSQLHALEKAHENGAYIVLVDPRRTTPSPSPTSGCPSTRAPTWRWCWP